MLYPLIINASISYQMHPSFIKHTAMRIFLLHLFMSSCLCLLHRHKSTLESHQEAHLKTSSLANPTQHSFTQIVDHYNYNNQQTWNQRYWSISQYFHIDKGPVLLYICGEWTCSGHDADGYVSNLAQKLNALILIVEHRYYGQSLPFGKQSFSLRNLQYLSSEQALKDLAYFTGTINEKHLFSINNNGWICVGGSYPGALSAWFRYKYAHLVIGAISSSGVILTVEDFTDFDQQIYLSTKISGDYCVNALNSSNAKVETILASNQSAYFKEQFQANDLSDEEFLYFWAESIVVYIQYGQRTRLCDSLKGKSQNQQFQILVNNAKKIALKLNYLKKKEILDSEDFNERCWEYQTCTEFGFWQTPSILHPMRSQRLNISFYKQYCSDTFERGMWTKASRKNLEYGGLNLKASNLLVANGIEDPWRWASLPPTFGNIISRVADCTNCAHCVDLATPSVSDDESLIKMREEQYQTVLRWIFTHRFNQT